MGKLRINWTMAGGGLLIAVAVIFLVRGWTHDDAAVAGDVPKGADQKPMVKRGPTRSASANDSPDRQKREARPAAASTANNPIHQRLDALQKAGNLIEIHQQLETLAESHELAKVRELLTDWCRKGPMELAQWSLTMSRDSDPELNLALYAEALSNPEEIIREIASSEIASKSGVHFKDSAQARAWLASQRGR